LENNRPKLTPGLLRNLGQANGDAQLPIIVQYSPTRRVMRHGAPMRGTRSSYNYRLRPLAHMHAIPEAIKQLETDPEVVKIFEDLPVRAYLDASVPQIQAPRLWDVGLSGEGIRIALIDTGVDAEHPDLEGRVASATDFTGEGPLDQHGHGTHCASVAAGSGAASEGRYRGGAPGATIYTAKVLRSDGEGMMSDVMAGIEWAVSQGVQVLSLSLGGPGPCAGTDALSYMCDAAVEAGVIVCVAAGNDGPSGGTVGTPGCARRVITVGAVNDLDRVASFSSRGPTADGRLKPDVVLPGVNIIAARAQDTSAGIAVGEHYISLSGSSMATPHCAGVCALLLQADPDMSPDAVKARLMATAIDLGSDPNAQGKGRVDAWRAHQGDTEPTPGPTPPSPGPAPGQGCLTALLQLLFWGRESE
jgi:serine protease AprX